MEPELRRSRYSYFVDRGGEVIGYNARTGTFALLASDVAAGLRSDGPIPELDDAEELVRMGFLHYGDELEQVMLRYNQQRNLRHILHLTLVPTLGCNLSCDYCFQNEYRNARVMSPETQEATLRYVTARIVDGRTEVLCSWFGGEPLLSKDIVLDMSQKLRGIVDAEGGHLTMSIITNGTGLDSDTAKALSEVGITNAQVSFDALKYDGWSKRGVLDSTGGPSLILRNILEAREHIQIAVRVNVSRENANELPQIIETLETYGVGEAINLARVHDFEGETEFLTDRDGRRRPATVESTSIPLASHPGSSACGGCSGCGLNGPVSSPGLKSLPVEQPQQATGHGLSLTRPVYARLEREVFLTRPEGLQAMMRKLKPKSHFCSATAGHMFVIDPAGYVSRCWHSAGSPSEAMGKVHDTEGALEETPVAERWRNYAPFLYPTCSGCKVLPLCMGGCSHARLFMDASNPPCESIKQQIQFCVEQVGTRIDISSEQRALVS